MHRRILSACSASQRGTPQCPPLPPPPYRPLLRPYPFGLASCAARRPRYLWVVQVVGRASANNPEPCGPVAVTVLIAVGVRGRGGGCRGGGASWGTGTGSRMCNRRRTDVSGTCARGKAPRRGVARARAGDVTFVSYVGPAVSPDPFATGGGCRARCRRMCNRRTDGWGGAPPRASGPRRGRFLPQTRDADVHNARSSTNASTAGAAARPQGLPHGRHVLSERWVLFSR